MIAKNEAFRLSGAVAATALATGLVVHSPAPVPAPAPIAPRSHRTLTAADPALQTRLVSCGNSTQARIDGDDLGGTVTPGAGFDGRCDLIFQYPWPMSLEPICTAHGAHVMAATQTDLFLDQVEGPFTFECREKP